MKYDFKCLKCDKEVELEIPMKDYTDVKDKQVCSCSGKLERVQGWKGSVSLCNGMYGIDSGKGWTD